MIEPRITACISELVPASDFVRGNVAILARMPRQWNIARMEGHLLAVEHAAAASSFSFTGGTWIVAIFAAAAGAYLKWVAPIGIFVVYLITHTHGSGHTTGSELAWIVIAVIGGYVGWHVGGRAMLKHVGEREYRNRITAAKSVNSIWSRWFGDAN